MKFLMTFQYWTLWIAKNLTLTIHHVIIVYNDMFDHIDGILHTVDTMETQWKEDLYFAVKLADK